MHENSPGDLIRALTVKSSKELNIESLPELMLLAGLRVAKEAKDPQSAHEIPPQLENKKIPFNLSSYHLLETEAISEENLIDLCFAYYCEKGIGVEQSLTQAFQYLKQAADRGLDIAQNDVGYAYAFGKGIEKSEEQAFHNFSLAAFQNYAVALKNLALCYVFDFGTNKSYPLFVQYRLRALEKETHLSSNEKDRIQKLISYALTYDKNH